MIQPSSEGRLRNAHPGEILLEEFLKPWRMTPYRLARLMNVPPTRVDQIIKGRRGITADTAIRLSRAIGCEPRFWLGLQAAHDLEEAEQAGAAEYAGIQRYEHHGPLFLDDEEVPEDTWRAQDEATLHAIEQPGLE